MNAERATTAKCVIPWGAWARDVDVELSFHPSWSVQVVQPEWPEALTEGQISRALDEPIGGTPLRDLARRAGSVAIAVDDLTRPAGLEPLLSAVIDRLRTAGKKRADIRLIFGIAAHAPLSAAEMEKKVGGEVLAAVTAESHDAFATDMARIDVGSGKTVGIHRRFVDSGLKITVSTVMPHLYAGYSGGAKMVLPGLASIEDIEYTHKAVLMGLAGGPRQTEKNRFRDRIERVARAVGIDQAIHLTVNRERRISGVFAGDVVDAHRAAVRHAEAAHASAFPSGLDVVVLNAYPKDTELLQMDNAFIPLHCWPGLVRENGTVVVTAACSQGMGEHGLFEPGKRLHRKARTLKFLREKELVVYAPGVDHDEFHSLYSESYHHCTDWPQVTDFLETRHGDRCSVGVLPCAALQVPLE